MTIAKLQTKLLDRHTGTDDFRNALETANCVAELCIASEPIAYDSVFKAMKWRFPDTEDAVGVRIDQRRNEFGALLQSLGLDLLSECRRTLVTHAQMVDPNRELHVLLQMMRGAKRLKVKGAVGRSLTFITMAECLRRAAEAHSKSDLREEDEMGFGVWPAGARKQFYGTDRIFDQPATALTGLLYQWGVEHGTRVRCYVEGARSISYVCGCRLKMTEVVAAHW